MSADPLPWISWQGGNKDDRPKFAEYIANPQNFDLYAYVRNNPLIFTDPTGESIYAVFYTTGNTNNNPEGGDDALKRAAETRVNEIRNSPGFDSSKDVAIAIGVNSKQDFINSVDAINNLTGTFGKVAELSIFSHSGMDGPVFPSWKGASFEDRQFILNGGGIDNNQLRALHINWESNAWASFMGCRGKTFADAFGQIQGVSTFGYKGKTDFYSSPEGRWYQFGARSSGPVYMRPGVWNTEDPR